MTKLSENINFEELFETKTYLYNTKLNTCRGCVYRGSCPDEQYVSPGEYCSRYQSKTSLKLEKKNRKTNRSLKTYYLDESDSLI